jgi:hypothetical protein
MEDLLVQIERLSDRQAISALDLVLQSRKENTAPANLEAQERELREALAQPEVREQVAVRAAPSPAPVSTGADQDADRAQRGDLARATLAYLVEQGGGYRDAVAHAVARPAPPGTRDPFTLAVVGLVVLALRPVVDFGYDRERGWRFNFKTEPLKDSAMGKLLGKLISSVPPGPPGV